MNMERAALRSQIAIEEHKIREFKLEANLLRTVLREKLGAWIDIENIEVDSIELAAKQLCTAVRNISECAGKLKILEEAFNG